MPSPSSPRQRLRSGSYPKPTTSFTPINKPKSQTQKGEPAATLPMRPWSSKGQSKRGRTASGVTALGENEFQKEVDEQSTPHREGNNEDDTIPQLIEFERKSWWNPQAWIDRYETGFMIDFDVPGRLWLGLDPFKGWISDGPGKGTYMPGYEPPDDAAIAEAEKTAVLRYHLRTYDSDSEDYEQWKRDYFPDTRGLPEDECSPTQLASGVHQDTVATDIPECPVTDSKVKHPHCTSPSANFEQGPSSAHRTPSEVKALERAERVERTEQYVLTGNPGGGGINSQMTDLPTKNPDENTSPLSAASETTSTLIARQLIADCTSLSSQVLANLTNLSQADRNTRISSVTQRMSKQCDFDDRYASASGSSEPISSIPARPPSKMSLPLTPKRGLNMALGSEHPIDKQVDARAKPRWIIPPNVSTKTNIEVVLPYMPAEERAEYEAVSPIEYSSYSPQPPTSFREINEATPSVDLESDESGEETLKYVLRQSPRWLNNVTEINESGETTEANKTKVSSKLPINSSSRTPSMDLDTPQENSSHIPKAAATDTSCRSSNIEGRGKMMAYYPTSVFPSTELPLSKKQKMTDGGWDPRRDKKLSQRRRRRRRKLWEKRRRESKSSNSQLRFS
ncbi:hypothetical protein K445DRAFT_321889 [Daldinia sp. EC12]|nr:hypothetical protein K445DRAFT_321889 [Daldinia sp. EC12]